MRSNYLLPIFEVALAITLWALSFVFIKIALAEIAPATLIVLRYGLGFVLLGLAAAWRGDLRRLERADWARMACLGAVGVALQQFLQVSGQATAEASAAAFLASTAPAFMVLLAALWLREPVRAGQILGILLATGGGIVVAVGENWGALAGGEWLKPGNWLVLLSAVIWALYTVMTRRLQPGRPPLLITAGMFAFGWLLALPVFLLQRGWQQLPTMTARGWGAVLFVGILSTALTYLLYSHALSRAPASRLAAIQNIEPLIATLAAIWLLDEHLTTTLLLGGAAILVGVFLSERSAPGREVLHEVG
jgi:drug/metabolite transporter (DMT)-like permease